MNESRKKFDQRSLCILLLIACVGIGLRFYQIKQNNFVYYDEGMWLNHNRQLVNLISNNPPQNFFEFGKVLTVLGKYSLQTAKALWSFISGLRGLFLGAEDWYFTRIVSAVFGSFTLWVLYLFARRNSRSTKVAMLSVAILAVFPSHVYYSRLGLQEAFSTFCFVTGLYLYLYPRKMGIRVFLSSFLFACVFFANYRMIIIPVLVVFSEFWISLTSGERPNIRKLVWNVLGFLALIFGVGALQSGSNTYITFSWMFHQAHLAQAEKSLLTYFSFPYYIFRLESLLFGILFFGNVFYVFRKDYQKLYPFALVIFQMLLFSFTEIKGVRYMCNVMPFMVLAGANLSVDLWQMDRRRLNICLLVFLCLMFGHFLLKDYAIVTDKTDYAKAIEFIRKNDASAKVLSTQSEIQKLFASNNDLVKEAPKQTQQLLWFYSKGYRYLVIDPQAYVSFTKNKQSFHLPLVDYMEFLRTKVKPIQTYTHFSQSLLDRFVLEHNANLRQSLSFLKESHHDDRGNLKIYDLKTLVSLIRAQQLLDDR